MMSSYAKATSMGLFAAFLWSCMPYLASFVEHIPPFQLISMCFLLAFAGFVLWQLAQKKPCIISLPLSHWGLAVWGIFGFNFCYFIALRYAPTVQAFLIIELWPLLLVLLLTITRQQRLTLMIAIGSLIATLGAATAVTKGAWEWPETTIEHVIGYALSITAALIWAVYSLLVKKWEASVPTEASGFFCGVAAVLSIICHLTLETAVIPSLHDWIFIIVIAIGPIGGSYFLWNHGMQYGNAGLLTMSGFGIPIVGSVILVLGGAEQWHSSFLPALLLVVVGCVMATPRATKKIAEAATSAM